MKRRLLTTLILSWTLFSTYELSAQNNPYGIKDTLYNYVQKTSDHIGESIGYKMADTLFAKAKRIKDLNAQCLALDFKVWHFHKTGQIEKERLEFKKVAPFILKSPYKKYYFSCWNMRINEFIIAHNYPMAINEISKYREKAFALKNNFGIIESYNMEGGLYYSQEVYRYALPLYYKALQYAKKTNDKEIYRYYKNVSIAALRLHRFEEAEKAAKMSIKTAPNNESRIGGYCALLSIFCVKDTDKNVIRKTYEELEKIDDKVVDKSINKYSRSEAMYNYYEFFLNNKKLALKEYESGFFNPDSAIIYMRAAKKYEAEGKLKEAVENYINYCNYIEDKNIKDGDFLLTAFVPQIDFDNIEFEREALEEKKYKIRLKQLRINEQILKLKNERNQAHIIKRDKEHSIMLSKLASRKIEIQRQNNMMKNAKIIAVQQKNEYTIVKQKELWENTLIVTLATATFILLALYIIYKLDEQKELKEKKEKAEKAEKTKSLFFQNMNHEIRSPLNAIIGFNDLLCSDVEHNISSEERAEIINMISTNSNLLITLVNDVLDLSNLESGSYKLNWVDSDIQHLCKTTIESIRGRQAEGVELRTNFNPTNRFILYTDEQRLQQILINFLTNACKYTKKGSITLSYDVLPDVVRFSVTDTGCGIKPEYADKIFERFSMLDKAKTGNGLGLHICKIITGLLHGKIYIDKEYKRGARFVFDHPISNSILSIVLFMCSCLPLHAGEIYKSPNEIQKYQWAIENHQYDERSIAMTDTMIVMARKAHDIKAEGKALELRTKCFFNLRKEDLMLKNFNVCKVFSIKHKIYSCMFNSWSTVIDYYLLQNELDKAMIQLKSFRVMTEKTKDISGMGLLLYNLGTFYFVQKRYGTALSYYIKAIDYTKVFENLDYIMIGNCYRLLGNNENAVMWFKKSIKMPSSDVYKIHPLIGLLECYSKMGQTINAIRTESEIKKILWNYPNSAKYSNYHESMYFFYLYILKDREKALDELLKTGDSDNAKYNLALYYYSVGEYEKANAQLKEDVIRYTKWLKSNPLSNHDYYISQFDYKQAMRDRNKLAMRNIHTEIENANNAKEILMMKNEQSEWVLMHADINDRQAKALLKLQELKLQNNKEKLNRQNIIRTGEQKQRILGMERAKYRSSTIGFIALFIIGCTAIIIYRIQTKAKRMAYAAKKAQDAEKEKNDFFESINKEIRKPIDNIIRINKELNDSHKEILKAEKDDAMNILHDNADYLHKLVNKVLDVSKLESGTYIPNMTNIVVYTLCNEIIHTFELEKHVTSLILNSDTNDYDHNNNIISDKTRLKSAINSLIEIASVNSSSNYIYLSYVFGADSVSFIISHIGTTTQDERKDISLSEQMVRLTAELLKGKTSKTKDKDGSIRYTLEVPTNI